MALDNTSFHAGRRGGGQSAGAPNPSQPQLKAVPMIARMEEAKRKLRMPYQPGGGPAPHVMRGTGGGMSPGGPGGADSSVDSGPIMTKPAARPTSPMMPPPGAEPGGSPSAPGAEDPYAVLPPRMRETARAAGRDPREAVASRMANDPNFRQQMIQQFTGGSPGGPPAGNPGMPGSAPDISVSSPGGSDGPGMASFSISPGAEPGGPMSPQAELQQRLQRMRPPQGMGGGQGQAQPQGQVFNPGSLADLYSQVMPGRSGPPQYGGAGGGQNPFGLGPVGAYSR